MTPLLTPYEQERYPVFCLKLEALALPGVKQVLHRNHKAELAHLQLGMPSGLCPDAGDRQRLRFWTNPHNALNIIATLPPESEPELGQLHVSVSLPHRMPTWGELKAVKEATFGPLLDAMQVLPRQELYYNYHPFCLHLWEMPLPWRIDRC